MSKLLFFDLETTGVKFWRNGTNINKKINRRTKIIGKKHPKARHRLFIAYLKYFLPERNKI